MPKIDLPNWTKHEGDAHPLTGQNYGPYMDIALSKLLGLKHLGLRMECLPPGSSSSHRHWHETEDEFMYLISGHLTLVEDVETQLQPGDCAAWPAGDPVAHCLQNRGDQDAIYLIIAANKAQDIVHYPDHDIVFHRNGENRHFTHTDGKKIDWPRLSPVAYSMDRRSFVRTKARHVIFFLTLGLTSFIFRPIYQVTDRSFGLCDWNGVLWFAVEARSWL